MKKIFIVLLAVLALTSAQANETTEDKKTRKLDNTIKCFDKLSNIFKRYDEIELKERELLVEKRKLDHQREEAILELAKSNHLIDATNSK